jgi:hypothetical protein
VPIVLGFALVLACTSPDIAVADAIEVSAGATCLDDAALAGSVALWLERDRIAAGIAVRVRGDAALPSVVEFEIARGDVHSSPRRMEDLPASCEALHAAVGLAIAVAIDTSVLGGALQPSPAPAPAAVQVPRTSVVAPSPPAVSTRTERLRRVEGYGSLGAVLGVGLTPGVAYGADLRGGIALRVPIAFELGATALVGPQGRFAGGQLRSILGYAHSRICTALPGRRVIARACVGVAAGGLRMRGLGFPEASASTVPWVAVGPGFELFAPARGRAGVAARVDLWVSTIRTRVEAGGPGDTVAASAVLPPMGIAVIVGPLARSR